MASRFRSENIHIEWLAYLTAEAKPEVAQDLLRQVADIVKPIMQKNNLRVRLLTEFYPTDSKLGGLNENNGHRILLRLRLPHDRTQFYEVNQIVDTMLHELVHNDIGPHNDEFHKRWNEYRAEVAEGPFGGWDGNTPFLRNSFSQMNVQAHRGDDEPSNLLDAHKGRKLGGAPLDRNKNVRDAAARAAIERRNLSEQSAPSNEDAPETTKKSPQEPKSAKGLADEVGKHVHWDQPDTNESVASSSGSKSQRSSKGRAGTQVEKRGWVCDFCAARNPAEWVNCKRCGVKRRDVGQSHGSSQSRKGKERAE